MIKLGPYLLSQKLSHLEEKLRFRFPRKNIFLLVISSSEGNEFLNDPQ